MDEQTQSLAGVRVAALVEDMYEDLELWYPVLRLRAAGADVRLVGVEAGAVYTGRSGYLARADVGAAEVNPADLHAVVIPGGYAPDRMRRCPEMVDIVRRVNASSGLVAAICHAGWMLVEADVLNGRTVACFFSIRRDLENSGATVLDEAVVEDRNLITSRTPEDLPQFGEALVDALVRLHRNSAPSVA